MFSGTLLLYALDRSHFMEARCLAWNKNNRKLITKVLKYYLPNYYLLT